MKLHEVAKQLDPHAKIKKWLDEQDIKNYTIRPNGVVDVDGDVDLRSSRLTSFPVQFGNVSGYFYCSHSKLTSLNGVPQYIGGDFYCNNTEITSLAGCPQTVGGRFDCFNTKITSLTGVDKIIKHIGGKFVCNQHVTHLLGLLLIKGIVGFDIDSGGPIDKIMNKYIGTGDILSAQDELIDAGFTDQARL
jgi:hypothetical protein